MTHKSYRKLHNAGHLLPISDTSSPVSRFFSFLLSLALSPSASRFYLLTSLSLSRLHLGLVLPLERVTCVTCWRRLITPQPPHLNFLLSSFSASLLPSLLPCLSLVIASFPVACPVSILSTGRVFVPPLSWKEGSDTFGALLSEVEAGDNYSLVSHLPFISY